jgi:hypothetical protein
LTTLSVFIDAGLPAAALQRRSRDESCKIRAR